MCKCLSPDERLFQFDDKERLEQRIKQLEEKWNGNKRFPCGICGAMWYGTPVVGDNSHSRIKWRYGVEFEVEFHRVTTDGETEYDDFYRNMAIIANDYLGSVTKWGHGGITEDHSLDRGFEIILPAMSITKSTNIIQSILLDYHIRKYLRHSGNASMHVTVDPFDTIKQQKAFHNFWDHPDFYDDFKGITCRDENGYCRRRKARRNWRGADGFMKPDTLQTHYHRCNVRKNGAMEVRVFQAVYDVDQITKQLMLVDQVNKLVRKGVKDYEEIKNIVQMKMSV
ncbi:MAG: hypothetical protein Q4A60_07365 [Pasteurellaceae bacterium]|nr:hypothetical protein [Pasteurellaceae bacterium]